MAQGIDFTAMIRGQQAADNANWANIRRIQDQDDYALKREAALALRQQQQQGQEASHYLSTILPNLQRYADQGLNPVDALINQREAIQNDPAYASMAPEVQTQVLNGLGQTAALQMQQLKNAGNYTELQRLVETFGGTNPVNQLGAAINSGDPTAIFNAVKGRGANIELVNGEVVDGVTGQKVPLLTWAANVAGGAGAANSAAGSYGAFHQQGQQDRTLAAAEQLQKQQDTQQAMLALRMNISPAEVRATYPNADPALFAAAAVPGAAAGPTVATPEQVAALSTPVVAGPVPAATPGLPAATGPALPPAIQQLVTQIRTAPLPLLNSYATGVQQQVQQKAAKFEQLDAAAKARENRIGEIERRFSDSAAGIGGFLSGAERQALAQEKAALEQELAGIRTQSATFTSAFRQLQKVADEIQAARNRLNRPALGAVPTATPELAGEWAAQMMKGTGK